jgi:DNA-binding MarR family transcriptional regulator
VVQAASDPTTHAFLIASRALVGVAARSLAAEDDITLPQFRALVVLLHTTNTTDLAEALDIHQSTATRLCDRLVRKRLVQRAVDAADRRRVSVSLTASGRRLVQRVTERRARAIAAVTARMTPAQRRQAVTAMRAFAVAAGEPGAVDLFGWPET